MAPVLAINRGGAGCANADDAQCGNHPEWVGPPCVTKVAGAVSGQDAARMSGALPVKRTTGYTRFGSPTVVTETATGPVAGASATQTRTTTTSYDAADRVTSVTITGTGPGVADKPVAKTVMVYDKASGDVVETDAVDASGAVTGRVKKTFDALGRTTSYDDGAGNVTTSVFDQFGKPTKVSDSLGASTTYTYDRTKEPRGLLTSSTDSVAGTQDAVYGPDGQLFSQTLPGGVSLAIGYDPSGGATSRTYTRTSDGAFIATANVLENGAGQVVTSTTPASAKAFSYDGFGRLTDAKDTVTATGTCTWRRYAYNDHAGRTAKTTAASGTSTCADPGNPGTAAVSTVGYSYDSADRLVSDTATGAGAWTYDPLGRVTGAPVDGQASVKLATSYYANDLVAAQQVDGVAQQSWTLDPLQRVSAYTGKAWVPSGTSGSWAQAVTKVDHYDSDSDEPAWIAENTTLPNEVTRYVDGMDGDLAIQTGKTGNRVLQLTDLQGSIMATLPIQDGQATAAFGAIAFQAADEFGVPTDLSTGRAVVSTGAAPDANHRYGWLGGKQRSDDALGGVVLMGVRLYSPSIGRFLSPDPVPGGNATAYDYCSGDPVNCTDLDGRWSWKGVLKKVAKYSEYASYIPGPVGLAATAVSAGAYLAAGNKKKALSVALSAPASMIPGGKVLAHSAVAVAGKSAGRVAAKAGKIPHGNSLSFKGPSHVYQIFEHHASGAVTTYKYGKGGAR